MDQIRAFVALIAPWLASPGDVSMRMVTVVVIAALIIIGASAVGYGGVVAIRELIAPHREVAP